MKILIKITAFFLMAVYVFFSCKKDNGQTTVPPPPNPPPSVNRPPIARAGADLSFTLPSCGDRINAELDGSGSTDPDNDIISYSWRKISGPGLPPMKNSTLAKALVEYVRVGDYAFELTVTDAKYLASKDTMLISVKATFKEYDLDITFNGTFNFFNNDKDCYYTPCSYNDISLIEGKATFLPIGEFNLSFSEYADTATLKYAGNSYFSLYRSTTNTGIYGTSSVNLKKLYQQGGGPFNGTFIVTYGSAINCDPNVFKNLAPLNVTGSIDTAAHKAIIRIYGKTYF